MVSDPDPHVVLVIPSGTFPEAQAGKIHQNHELGNQI